MAKQTGVIAIGIAVLAACAAGSAQPTAPSRDDDGITIERVRATLAPEIDVGDRTITIVRVDPSRYRFGLWTAERDAGARTVVDWARDFHLTGVINAAMYEADGRSVGLLVQEGVVRTARDDARFGGFLALDPIAPGRAPFTVHGRDCDDFDLARLRASHRTLVQSYRLLGCDGRAIDWADEKHYSAAAIGMDRDGRVALVHVRTPYRMARLAQMLAAPELRLRSMIFVEGGPEASLVVSAGERSVSEVGSYETTFHERDDNTAFWRIPNVIGFAPR